MYQSGNLEQDQVQKLINSSAAWNRVLKTSFIPHAAMLPFKFRSGVMLFAARPAVARASEDVLDVDLQASGARLELIRARNQAKGKQAELGRFNKRITALSSRLQASTSTRDELEKKNQEVRDQAEEAAKKVLDKHDKIYTHVADVVATADTKRKALKKEIRDAKMAAGKLLFEKVKPVSIAPVQSTSARHDSPLPTSHGRHLSPLLPLSHDHAQSVRFGSLPPNVDELEEPRLDNSSVHPPPPQASTSQRRVKMGWSSTSLRDDILRAIAASEVLEMHVEQDEAQRLQNFIYDMLSDGHEVQNILDGSVTYHGRQGSGEKHDVDLDNSLCSSHRAYVALCPPGPRRPTPPLSFDPTSPNLTPRARRTRAEDVGEEEEDAEREDERRHEKVRLGKRHAVEEDEYAGTESSHSSHQSKKSCVSGRKGYKSASIVVDSGEGDHGDDGQPEASICP